MLRYFCKKMNRFLKKAEEIKEKSTLHKHSAFFSCICQKKVVLLRLQKLYSYGLRVFISCDEQGDATF